jgi:hypothetical protein
MLNKLRIEGEKRQINGKEEKNINFIENINATIITNNTIKLRKMTMLVNRSP